MKFFFNTLLIGLLSYAACLFLPWWSIAIVAFLVSFVLPQKNLPAFLAGFVSLLLLWGVLSYFISVANDHVLANKASVLILKKSNPILLVILTACIGGLVAALAALSGNMLRKLLLAKD